MRQLLKKLSVSNVLILALLLGMAQSASAGLIAVVADVNADGNSNFSFYDAILASNTSVAFSRNQGQQGDLLTHYNSLAGVTAAEDNSVLTNGVLSAYDMLVITRNFNIAVDYTAAEIAAISSFGRAGGTILAILESQQNSANLAGYNNLLSGIGSGISFNGGRTCISPDIMNAESTSLGPLNPFTVDCYNYLDGDTAVYIAPDGVAVAFNGASQAVPEPATLAILSLGLFGLAFMRRRRA